MIITVLILALLPSWATSIPDPPPGHTLCSAPVEPSRALTQCPSGTQCSLLDISDCLVCHCPTDCDYGRPANATCSVASEDIKCDGNRTFFTVSGAAANRAGGKMSVVAFFELT